MTDSSSTIEKLPASRRKLRVQGSSADVKKAFKAAIQQVNKSVTIPGFRKGKAPDKLIEAQFSQAVDKAWRDETANVLILNALKENNIVPLFNRMGKPRLEKISIEDGAVVDVEFEVEPESPTVDLSDFSFEPIETPEPESAEEALETLRTYHGKGEEVTDRPSQNHDLVNVDIDLIDGDKTMEISRGKTFFLEPKRVSEWLYNAIIGKEIGQPFEAVGEGADGKVGTEGARTFNITIKSIQKMIPHDLDDDFWKKLGVENKEQFEERFKKEHERQVANFIQGQKRYQIAEFLKKKFPLELPKGLIDYETEVILRNTVHDYLRQGVTEDWVKNNAFHLRSEAEKIATERLLTTYLVLKEAKDKNVTVLITELQREKMYEEMVRPLKERILLAEMNDKEKENRLYFEILTQKTLDLLVRQVEGVSK